MQSGVSDIATDESGNVWVAHMQHGLLKLNSGSLQVIEPVMKDGNYTVIGNISYFKQIDGNLIGIVKGFGFLKLNNGVWEELFPDYKSKFNSILLHDIIKTGNTFYITSQDSGLYMITQTGSPSGIKAIVTEARNETLNGFPNPVDRGSSFYIETSEPLNGSMRIALYSIDGRQIEMLKLDIASQKGRIILPNVKPGVYFVVVPFESGAKSMKLIIE